MSHAEKLEADGPAAPGSRTLAKRMASYIEDARYIAGYVRQQYHPLKTPSIEDIRAMQEWHRRQKDEFRRVSEAKCGYNAENDNGEAFKPAAVGAARPQPKRCKPIKLEAVPVTLVKRPVGVAKRILLLVATEFGLTIDELRSDSRLRKIVAPRYLAMKLLADQLDDEGKRRFTYQQIAHLVGKSDHSTVTNGIDLFDVRAKQYPALAEAYERITEALG